MTASERLRALWDESADNPDASLRLANATLYLADVVEAAEEVERAWFGEWARNALKGSMKHQRDALTALREHLEGT